MKILKIFLLINLLLFSSCGYKVLNNIDDVNFKIIRLDGGLGGEMDSRVTGFGA